MRHNWVTRQDAAGEILRHYLLLVLWGSTALEMHWLGIQIQGGRGGGGGGGGLQIRYCLIG